jgi:N utilization substance protein A
MREVVEEVENPDTKPKFSRRSSNDTDEPLEIGDEYIEEITLDNISDSFGRRLISLAAQNLNQKIREVEKDNIYTEYANRSAKLLSVKFIRFVATTCCYA